MSRKPVEQLPKSLARCTARIDSYQNSRFNALKHGILSKATILPWEKTSEYHKLMSSYVRAYEPRGPAEEHLLKELVNTQWRLRRVKQAELGAYVKDSFHELFAEQGMECKPLDGFLREKEPPDYSFLSTVAGINPGMLLDIEEHDEEWDLEDKFILTDALNRAVRVLDLLAEQVEIPRERLIGGLHYHTRGTIEIVENALGSAMSDEQLSLLLTEFVVVNYNIQLNNLNIEDQARLVHRAAQASQVELNNLARYETALDRKYQKTLLLFLKLQKDRMDREALDV